jgi:aspartyl/asparaginyl beta-hydroxylase (cupin superfamily)
MQGSRHEWDVLERQADEAAARGDAAAAGALLERICGGAPERIESWLKLAGVRRARGAGLAGALDAVSRALEVDPLHFIALLTRARLLETAGRDQDAAKDYLRALAQAPVDPEQIPARLQPIVDHARRTAARYQAGVARNWDAAIASVPVNADEQRRLERFKTNALRETRVFHSGPSHYHYPGLIEREFHDRGDFPWLSKIEVATETIRSELLGLLAGRRAQAEPYVRYARDAPVRQWAALNHSLDWTAYHLLRGGVVVPANADRCPETMTLLAGIPQPRMRGRAPNAMFSLLKPRTRIPPHTGIANTRLVCHLPLVVPDGCWFRVGAERREWRVGEAFVFDDTIEHEAANDSDEPRIVLIFDLWHPGLSAAERDGISAVMAADEAAHGALL